MSVSRISGAAVHAQLRNQLDVAVEVVANANVQVVQHLLTLYSLIKSSADLCDFFRVPHGRFESLYHAFLAFLAEDCRHNHSYSHELPLRVPKI